eukprot:GHUV01033731.1.p1 GENE.GHUV01033731.1~~GHUV01033731.1.p1  ORF type:complete len:452 (+),score=68.74 GHUV01033731.1:178-1356(+)
MIEAAYASNDFIALNPAPFKLPGARQFRIPIDFVPDEEKVKKAKRKTYWKVWVSTRFLDMIGQHKTAHRLKYGYLAWEVMNSCKTDKNMFFSSKNLLKLEQLLDPQDAATGHYKITWTLRNGGWPRYISTNLAGMYRNVFGINEVKGLKDNDFKFIPNKPVTSMRAGSVNGKHSSVAGGTRCAVLTVSITQRSEYSRHLMGMQCEYGKDVTMAFCRAASRGSYYMMGPDLRSPAACSFQPTPHTHSPTRANTFILFPFFNFVQYSSPKSDPRMLLGCVPLRKNGPRACDTMPDHTPATNGTNGTHDTPRSSSSTSPSTEAVTPPLASVKVSSAEGPFPDPLKPAPASVATEPSRNATSFEQASKEPQQHFRRSLPQVLTSMQHRLGHTAIGA